MLFLRLIRPIVGARDHASDNQRQVVGLVSAPELLHNVSHHLQRLATDLVAIAQAEEKDDDADSD